MTVRWARGSLGIALAVAIGCSATSRHKALTMFFDGVPPLASEPGHEPQPLVTATTIGSPARSAPGSEHGPYAAKMCNACHEAGVTNALVVPKDELCFRCHTLRTDVRYVHGPLASGGCVACHDPHSSRHRYLLVGEAEDFCLGCHDRDVVARIEGHGGTIGHCTDCHDAHGSDTKYLLK